MSLLKNILRYFLATVNAKNYLAMFFATIILHHMKHGYAFRIDPEPLREEGASQVWYDADKLRENRAAMMAPGAMRQGDELIIYSMHNLAGSPRAFRRWEDSLRAKGIGLRLVGATMPIRKPGRPRKYDPTPAQRRRHHAIWTDGNRTEADRLIAISEDYGERVTRQTMFGRYGGPSNPKPL